MIRARVLFAAVTAIATCWAAALGSGSPAAADAGDSGATGATQCPASNPPNTLALISGTPQTAQLGSAFASPLAVELANTNGCPVTTALAGIPVTFTAPASGASATFAASGSDTLTVGTDASGNASAAMVNAGQLAGDYTVTATSAYGSLSFALTNTAAGIPATLIALAPATRSARADSRYASPLAVRVLDADGNPVAGATVTFNLGGGATGASAGGSASAGATFADGTTQASEQTAADGVASSPPLVANAVPGTFTATASVAHVGAPASFTLRNLIARPSTIGVVGPGARSATVDARYRAPLRVVVRGPHGTPVAGATVTFALGAGGGAGASTATGAGATFADGTAQATATTGASGIASSPRLRANSVAGSFTATATAAGLDGVARFSLTNHPGRPAAVAPGVASSESAPAGTRFPVPLAVTVTDAEHNRVAGVRVTFTAPSSGASGSFTGAGRSVTVRTNSAGVAVAPPFDADGTQGGYVVIARTPQGVATAFALVNQAP